MKTYAWRQMICEECCLPKLTVAIGADRCFCAECLANAIASSSNSLTFMGFPMAKIYSIPQMLEALQKAEQFLKNGIELGYVRMPELLMDSAHQTLPMITKALTKAGVKPQ
jgi:hypothetical protein